METKLCCLVATAGHPIGKEAREDFSGVGRLSTWFHCMRCDAKLCDHCYKEMYWDSSTDIYGDRDGNKLWWSLTLCGTCKHANDTVHPERVRKVCTCPTCLSSSKTSVEKTRASDS
jgi:hypothetical protein